VIEQTYHARGNCGKDYLRQQINVFVEGKKANFDVGLN
jgi:hypothetical protein